MCPLEMHTRAHSIFTQDFLFFFFFLRVINTFYWTEKYILFFTQDFLSFHLDLICIQRSYKLIKILHKLPQPLLNPASPSQLLFHCEAPPLLFHLARNWSCYQLEIALNTQGLYCISEAAMTFTHLNENNCSQ